MNSLKIVTIEKPLQNFCIFLFAFFALFAVEFVFLLYRRRGGAKRRLCIENVFLTRTSTTLNSVNSIFDALDDAVFFSRWGYDVSQLQHFAWGRGHNYSNIGFFKHRNIVMVISAGDDLMHFSVVF